MERDGTFMGPRKPHIHMRGCISLIRFCKGEKNSLVTRATTQNKVAVCFFLLFQHWVFYREFQICLHARKRARWTKLHACLLPLTVASFIANAGVATPSQKSPPGWARDKKEALSSAGPARPSGYSLPRLCPLVLRIQLLLNHL